MRQKRKEDKEEGREGGKEKNKIKKDRWSRIIQTMSPCTVLL